MTRLSIPSLAILTLALGFPVTSHAAYPSELFSFTELRFDASRQACGIDCILQNRTMQKLLESVAGSMGVNPAYIKAAQSVYPTSNTPSGEETTYDLPFPSGYKYCSSKVSVVSIMSASPDPKRRSRINAKLFPTHIGIYTWTGAPQAGEGQSSVEGYAVITGIKPEYFDEFKSKGICRDAPSLGTAREILDCAGNPCPERSDGSVSNAGNRVPALTTPPPAGY